MKNKKGFTLIEIIVVVLLIAIVVAITIPSIINKLGNTKDKKYNTYVDLIKENLKMYAIDNKEDLLNYNYFSPTLKNEFLKLDQIVKIDEDVTKDGCSIEGLAITLNGEDVKDYNYFACIKCANKTYGTCGTTKEDDYYTDEKGCKYSLTTNGVTYNGNWTKEDVLLTVLYDDKKETVTFSSDTAKDTDYKRSISFEDEVCEFDPDLFGISIRIDKTKPICKFENEGKEKITKGEKTTYKLTCSDNNLTDNSLSSKDFTVNGNSITISNINKSIVNSEEVYEIEVSATDNSGESSITLNQNKIKDKASNGNDAVSSNTITNVFDNSGPLCNFLDNDSVKTILNQEEVNYVLMCKDDNLSNNRNDYTITEDNFYYDSKCVSIQKIDISKENNAYKYNIYLKGSTNSCENSTLQLKEESVFDYYKNANSKSDILTYNNILDEEGPVCYFDNSVKQIYKNEEKTYDLVCEDKNIFDGTQLTKDNFLISSTSLEISNLVKDTEKNDSKSYVYKVTFKGKDIKSSADVNISFNKGLTDNYGNVGSKTINGNAKIKLIYDSDGPEIRFVSSSVKYAKSDTTVSINLNVLESGSGIDPTTLKKDDIKIFVGSNKEEVSSSLKYNSFDSENMTYSYTLTLTNLKGDGNLSLSIDEGKITDIAGNGNKAVSNLDVNVLVDNTKPIIKLDGNPDKETINKSDVLELTLKVEEKGSGLLSNKIDSSKIKVLIDGKEDLNIKKEINYQSDIESFILKISNTLEDGDLTLLISQGAIKDNALNESIETKIDPKVKVKNDVEGPVCSFTGPSKDKILTNEETTFILTCIDESEFASSGDIDLSYFNTKSTEEEAVILLKSVEKSKITNGYKYTITVTGNEVGQGIITLLNGTISDIYGNTNKNKNANGEEEDLISAYVSVDGVLLKDILLGDNNQNVVTKGDGLYKEEYTPSEDLKKIYQNNLNSDGKLATYYYKGENVNNYVSFAGFTWRVIRINEGDNSIRIMLNDDITNGTGSKFSSENSLKYSYYSTNVNDNITDSVSEVVTSWFEKQKLDDYYQSGIIVDSKFCEQLKLESGSDTSSYNPSFKCLTDTNGYFEYKSKVGLITLDEALYSGALFYDGSNDGNSFLTTLSPENGCQYIWTMSSSGLQDDKPSNFSIYIVGGNLMTYNSDTSYIGIHPVISLSKDVLVTDDGDGSLEKPFIVITE